MVNPASFYGAPADAQGYLGRVQRVVRRRVVRFGQGRCLGAEAAVGAAACNPLECGLAAPPVAGPSKAAASDEEQASLDRPCYIPMLRLTKMIMRTNPATNRRPPTMLQMSTAVAGQPPGLTSRMLPLSV